MKNFYGLSRLSFAFILGIFFTNANAQSTYDDIVTILSTNCATTQSCHGGNPQYSFDVNAPASELYDSLINGSVKNPYAVSQDYKLIDPGYPARSFLLRKVANCISGELAMVPAEGSPMPDNGTTLADNEIELIRQWILNGAPETGVVVDKAVIDEYYLVGGKPKIPQPAPPAECEGFQVHMGPIFLEPGEEEEYFQRYDLNLPDSVEVIGLEMFMNDESHHFILRKFKDGTAQNWPQGLTPLDPLTAFDSDKDYVMAWQNDEAFYLPNGTAYKWTPDESLDLNFHLLNPYQDEVVAGEVYLNVYTQPKGTALREMKSELINNFAFYIPNNSQSMTFSEDVNMTNKSIWTVSSHTHKYGTDYNVFLKNQGGGKGRQIFDGTYDYQNGFDRGIYDWEHPPTVYYEPLLDLSDTVNNGTVPNGLIHEATYLNNGPRAVTFGFTTEDEMMIIYVQYVDGTFNIPQQPIYTPCTADPWTDPCQTVGINTTKGFEGLDVSVFPNPFNNEFTVGYTLESNANVSLEVINLLGQQVESVFNNTNQGVGQYNININSTKMTPGIYLVKLTVNGESMTTKVIAE